MAAAVSDLRPYQGEIVAAVERQLASVRSTLVEAATGTGKTTIFAELVHRTVAAGGRGLVLVHRRELVEQATARLRAIGLSVGIERGSQRATVESVVVATVQTLRGARLRRWSPNAFSLVVVDEAHHAPAGAWRAVVDYFASARVLGVTATADRADNVALGTVFESVAARYGIVEAIRDRYLVPAIGLRVVVPGMDLSKVRQMRIRPRNKQTPREVVDLHPADLRRAALAPEAVEGVAGPLLALAGTRRTIVFAVDRAHAHAIADALNARRPGCADVVHGATRDREAVLARHRSGAIQFLVNVLVLTEGYDDPEISCVAMARPTQSRVLYAQACGRGLRLAAGKADCLVLDFTGVSCEFSLVGPDDVLAGALVEPTRTVTAGRAGDATPAVPVPYDAVNMPLRFVTRTVELLRRAGRAGRRGLQRGLAALLVE